MAAKSFFSVSSSDIDSSTVAQVSLNKQFSDSYSLGSGSMSSPPLFECPCFQKKNG